MIRVLTTGRREWAYDHQTTDWWANLPKCLKINHWEGHPTDKALQGKNTFSAATYQCWKATKHTGYCSVTFLLPLQKGHCIQHSWIKHIWWDSCLDWDYVFPNKRGPQLQKIFLSKGHAQCLTLHCCPPAHLLPYQDTLTAQVMIPLVREVAFHITQWKFEFLKFKTKLLIQILRATSAHLQCKNSTLLLLAQLWQCLPAWRDLKGCCSPSSPSSNKIKGTQQKKQSTPFSRAEYSRRILIHHLQENPSPTKLFSVMVQ